MKKSFGWMICAGVLLMAACQGANDDKKSIEGAASEPLTTIRVGSMGSDKEIWDHIAESEAVKDAGITLEIIEISGGKEQNASVFEGELDVNAFQSYSYYKSFVDEGMRIIAYATTYLEPMGLYSETITSVADIQNGATVGLSQSPADAARSLRLLQAAGLITLSDNFDDFGTVDDIVSNPKKLEFVEIGESAGPRSLPDLDILPIGNTIAMEGGLNVLTDSFFHEEVSQDTLANINVLVTTEEKMDDENIQKLAEFYHNEDTQSFIQEEFGGTKVPVEKDIDELAAELSK